MACSLLPWPRAFSQTGKDVKPPQRILLRPRLTPGQILRYRFSLESNSTLKPDGAIRDPHGPAQVDIVWDATVRLETALAVSSARSQPPPAMRIRMTYETSQADVRSDSPEPRSDEIRRQYAQLAGRSLEFTISPGGRVSDVRGLQAFLGQASAQAAAQKWIAQFFEGAGAPPDGVLPGQKWTTVEPADLPLAGRSWRTDFFYLRNAPCPALASRPSPAASAAPAALCAVIHSNLSLVVARKLRNSTPPDYKQRGLRTNGRWDASGQGEMYVSLDSGWIVSAAQQSTQTVDVVISPAAGDSAPVRQSGQTITRLQFFLLPRDAAPAAQNDPPSR